MNSYTKLFLVGIGIYGLGKVLELSYKMGEVGGMVKLMDAIMEGYKK